MSLPRRGGSPVFRYLSDHSAQLMKIKWLGYHSIHAERVVGRAILGGQMRRKHENVPAKGCIAKSSHKLDSSHSWHVVVGDEQVECAWFGDQRGERLLAVAHDCDFVTVRLQGKRDGERDRTLVFREQDIKGRRIHRGRGVDPQSYQNTEERPTKKAAFMRQTSKHILCHPLAWTHARYLARTLPEFGPERPLLKSNSRKRQTLIVRKFNELKTARRVPRWKLRRV